MIVLLPEVRRDRIVLACSKLFEISVAPIREVARIVGLLVASFSAVEFGRLYYRHLERAKIQALHANNGDFDAPMDINDEMRLELRWWIDKVRVQKRCIIRPPVDVEIYTDASPLGWGAHLRDTTIGGRWSDSEARLHINALELQAIWLALKSFRRDVKQQHVKIFCDNTTAVSYVNDMGGIHSPICNKLSFDIWSWCIEHDVWLTCAHVAGRKNLRADSASRRFVDKHEWKLDVRVFDCICRRFGKPELDLFASRLNAQLPCYCAWKPDPGASYIDAFSIRWTLVNSVYLFPPFSLLGRCVQKIREENARGIVIAPLWKTQPWFSSLMELLVDVPVLLRRKKGLLRIPNQEVVHPLLDKMRLLACKVSGCFSENRDFLSRQPISSCHPGNLQLENNMQCPSGSGYHTVVKGRLI